VVIKAGQCSNVTAVERLANLAGWSVFAAFFRVKTVLKNKARMLAYAAHKVSLKVAVRRKIVAMIIQLEVNLIHLAGRCHDRPD